MDITNIETVDVIPDPISLIESMRAIGYTVEAAVADIIDNSISASADSISIEYESTGSPFVAILDNGYGMGYEELKNAMRHGSRNPSDARDANDLGRFGLGLKTASLSQCRKLTVVSKQQESICALCWDLDYVEVENKWRVIIPNESSLKSLPLYNRLMCQNTGTLVVWQSLDRLLAGSINPVDEMRSRMSHLREHLSLVFHRFTQREGSNKPISMKLNGLTLPRIDPFLGDNRFRQPLEGQDFSVKDISISVKPFVLPSISHLSAEEIEKAGGREGLRRSQGFYIYRNRRLVIWGTWFKLVPKDEFFKLTRVQVDIPNSLDALWSLDIKKSAAFPPEIIRSRLKELIPHFISISRRTLSYSGRRTNTSKQEPIWNRIEPSPGRFKYEINIQHPLLSTFSDSLSDDIRNSFQKVLEIISAANPLDSIYVDMCADTKRPASESERNELLEIASNLVAIGGIPLTDALEMEPLSRFPHYHEYIKQEIEK